MSVDSLLLEVITIAENLLLKNDKVSAKRLASKIVELNNHILKTGELPQAWQPHMSLSEIIGALPDEEEPEIYWEDADESTVGLLDLLSNPPVVLRTPSTPRLELDLTGSE